MRKFKDFTNKSFKNYISNIKSLTLELEIGVISELPTDKGLGLLQLFRHVDVEYLKVNSAFLAFFNSKSIKDENNIKHSVDNMKEDFGKVKHLTLNVTRKYGKQLDIPFKDKLKSLYLFGDWYFEKFDIFNETYYDSENSSMPNLKELKLEIRQDVRSGTHIKLFFENMINNPIFKQLKVLYVFIDARYLKNITDITDEISKKLDSKPKYNDLKIKIGIQHIKSASEMQQENCKTKLSHFFMHFASQLSISFYKHQYKIGIQREFFNDFSMSIHAPIVYVQYDSLYYRFTACACW